MLESATVPIATPTAVAAITARPCEQNYSVRKKSRRKKEKAVV
ncbi:hypothetical protein [Wolbachia endosymbiont of Pentalonia nigronervosa]|nr:hypothetical protein [Wolbachia endosymbiont of Pentalonia nigronervosa]